MTTNMFLILVVGLLLVGCAEVIPRNVDTLIQEGEVYLDRETMKPFSGPVFEILADDTTRIARSGDLRDGLWDETSDDYRDYRELGGTPDGSDQQSTEPKIDGSSAEAYAVSLELVKASLDPETLVRFESAMMEVAFSGFGTLMLGALGGEDIESLLPSLLASVDGLSAAEIIAKRDAMSTIRRTERLQELISRRDAWREVQERLSGFKVESAEIQWVDGRTSLDERVRIVLMVENGLDVAVSRVYFKGEVRSADRSVPWVRGNFDHSIPGGIEPGERRRWFIDVYPWLDGDWSDMEIAPADAGFDVSVRSIEGPEIDEQLFDVPSWTDSHQAELNELMASVAR